MTISRFVLSPRTALIAGLLATCALGVYICLHAIGVLAGAFPPGRLPPYPSWAGAHFGAALVFAVLAPLQLWPALRRRRPRLHRVAGRTAVAAAAVMAVSGLAIACLAPERPISERIFMVLLFVAFAVALARGFAAARARDFARHRAWMVRTVALALTALTQRIVFTGFAATLGVHDRTEFWHLFMTAAWIAGLINLAAAEWWLRDRAAPAPGAAAAASPG